MGPFPNSMLLNLFDLLRVQKHFNDHIKGYHLSFKDTMRPIFYVSLTMSTIITKIVRKNNSYYFQYFY